LRTSAALRSLEECMAKISSVNKNNHRRKLVAQYAAKRKKLK
jgi:hypothetical protein